MAGAEVRWGPDGLVPVIAQDEADGSVLMLAWMDAEALAATLSTGLAHFHSRSRGRLWLKGETSGNLLRVRSVALDCDGDAILLVVEAAGAACHTGARTCFETEGGARRELAHAGGGQPPTAAADVGFTWLEELWRTIRRRAAAGDPDASYTARLIAGGVDACARKVTEEATEVLLAARDDAEAEQTGAPAVRRAATRAALDRETADLLYHALVLLAERSADPAGAIAVLRNRHRP